MNTPALPLTIIALAWNEADDLVPCFKSLQLLLGRGASTLIVLDHQADTATSQVARTVAQRVLTNTFENFASQRNFALSQASTDWVLFIDPDERATPELCGEIVRRLDGTCNAWRVPRRNLLFGHEVRYTGWWPDYQIRLMRREGTHYNEARKVHEVPVISGEVCPLMNPLIHFNYRTWRQFIAKQRSYAPLEAQALHAEGTQAHLRSLIGQPVREFARRFFQYQGWRDSLLGLALSLAMAAYKFEVYRQLRKL